MEFVDGLVEAGYGFNEHSHPIEKAGPMTFDPKKTQPQEQLGSKAREPWIKPEIEMLRIDETETLSGVGADGSFGQPADCTAS